MGFLVEIIVALIDGTVDFALIMAVFTGALAFIGALSLLGAFGFVLKAIVELVKAIRGVPPKVIKRAYRTHDGREVIEEIPYSPTMNVINAATHTVKELEYGRYER